MAMERAGLVIAGILGAGTAALFYGLSSRYEQGTTAYAAVAAISAGSAIGSGAAVIVSQFRRGV